MNNQSLQTTYGMNQMRASSAAYAGFWQHAYHKGYDYKSCGFTLEHSITSPALTFIEDFIKKFGDIEILHETSHSSFHAALFTCSTPEILCYVNIAHFSYITVELIGPSKEAVHPVQEWITEMYPEPKTEDGKIALEFWYHTAQGPRSVTRQLEAPNWGDIVQNYCKPVREEITRLVHQDWRPTTGGQMLLWQGDPGTGKTYTIRSVVKAWAPWCSACYITDPDRFFAQADYMMSVLLSNDDDNKWRLMILEDAGELLGKDARAQTGQALSKLLNITDGLVGQGLRIITLITTNEELRELHDAVQRPGRCLSKLHFQPLTRPEANKWLSNNGIETDIKTMSTTLAELYAFKEGYVNTQQVARPIGLRA